MIIKTIYNSKEEIPAGYEALFHSKGGKWVLNASEIEGIDDLTNPTLTTKVAELEQTKTALASEVTSLKADLVAAKQEVSTFKKPGTKIISADEAKQLEEYQAIGPVADVKKIQDEVVILREEKSLAEKRESLQEFCTEAGIDFNVLRDQTNTHFKDVEFFTKKEKTKDAKTKKDVEIVIPMVKVTVQENGKDKVSDHKLSDYLVTNKVPDYVAKSLFVEKKADAGQQNLGGQSRQPVIPIGSMGASASGGQGTSKTLAQKISERARQETSTRRKPWDPPVNATQPQ